MYIKYLVFDYNAIKNCKIQKYVKKKILNITLYFGSIDYNSNL
jgi:hypothetical protein